MSYYVLISRKQRDREKRADKQKRRIEMTKYIARNIRFVLSTLAAAGFGMSVN